jgi:DNA-binding transcriptional regulator of glucitol operon
MNPGKFYAIRQLTLVAAVVIQCFIIQWQHRKFNEAMDLVKKGGTALESENQALDQLLSDFAHVKAANKILAKDCEVSQRLALELYQALFHQALSNSIVPLHFPK